MKKLPRSFYLRPTLTVARELLGKHLCRRIRNKLLVGKIVEVEAYLGERDPASHAYRGKTKRNEVMFLEGGHLYVYFTYGMHFCANVVTEREGIGHAVLLRAVEPLTGIELMLNNRNRKHTIAIPAATSPLTPHPLPINLTNGPAKLCEAFGIVRSQNGADLLGTGIFITHAKPVTKSLIARSKRVGIRNGKEKRWRYYVRGNAFVSKK